MKNITTGTRLVLILSVFLTSCATPSHYYQPPDDAIDAPSLTNSSHHKDLSDWYRFKVTYIDDMQVSYQRPWFNPLKNMDTTPLQGGSHSVIIKSEFNKDGYDCPCIAIGKLTFEAQEGMTYRVAGEILDNSVDFWIEERDSGKAVSEKTNADYIKITYSSPITIVY